MTNLSQKGNNSFSLWISSNKGPFAFGGHVDLATDLHAGGVISFWQFNNTHMSQPSGS